MLTTEEFDQLDVGDVVETSPLFPALATDPVTLLTDKKEADCLEFVATYMGVTLGRMPCTRKDGELTWQTW